MSESAIYMYTYCITGNFNSYTGKSIFIFYSTPDNFTGCAQLENIVSLCVIETS